MRYTLHILLLLPLLSGKVYAQKDTRSVYKNLKTLKSYSVNLYENTRGHEVIYFVNDKEVPAKVYYKYEKGLQNMADCCPCLLQSYDEYDTLISEAVSCTDCGVGRFKEFHRNGKVKLSGQFKENPTGNWDGIWDRGYCNVKDGEWNYYNEQGILLYSEYWKEGLFSKQYPEQTKPEIWKIDLTLYGKNVDTMPFLAAQLKDLQLTPFYKNHATDTSQLIIDLNIGALHHRSFSLKFTVDSLKQFDLNTFLLEKGFASNDSIRYSLNVLHNANYIAYFDLHIITNLPGSTKTEIKAAPVPAAKIVPLKMEFYLTNAADSTKKIKLETSTQYDLAYTPIVADSNIVRKRVTLTGQISYLYMGDIYYNFTSEYIDILYTDGIESKTTNSSFFYNDRLIKQSSLSHIAYQSPKRAAINHACMMVMGFSILTTAIIAPLVSINYTNGNFNKDLYYAVAGTGLVGLTFSIPLATLTSPKNYYLTQKNNKQTKDYWYLEQTSRK